MTGMSKLVWRMTDGLQNTSGTHTRIHLVSATLVMTASWGELTVISGLNSRGTIAITLYTVS